MEKLDFYFNEEQRYHVKSSSREFERHYYLTRFKGKEYTECTPHGEKPLWKAGGETIFLGTGTSDDITIKEEF